MTKIDENKRLLEAIEKFLEELKKADGYFSARDQLIIDGHFDFDVWNNLQKAIKRFKKSLAPKG